MKVFGLAVLAFAATAAAGYSASDIPTCAYSCFETAAPEVGCGVMDSTCQCSKSDKLTSAMTPCVEKNCSASDALKTEEVSVGICKELSSSSAAATGTATATGSSSTGTSITEDSSSSTTTGTSSSSAAVQSANGAASGGVGMAGIGSGLAVAAGLFVL